MDYVLCLSGKEIPTRNILTKTRYVSTDEVQLKNMDVIGMYWQTIAMISAAWEQKDSMSKFPRIRHCFPWYASIRADY